MGGISNFQIENAVKQISDEDLLNNFVGVFPSNYMNKFINHAAMIEDKKGKYPFIIANTDASDKTGTHWWSILDIEPRNDILLFDSFGLDGLKNFIIQDDKKTIDKILIGIEQMNKTDKKLTKKEIDSLSDTARDFFHFVQAFGIKLKLKCFVNIWMVEDRIQDLDSNTCEIFQLYFYENMFNPNQNSKIENHTKFKKSTVESLLNELFSLDDKEGEIKMLEYAGKKNIKIFHNA